MEKIISFMVNDNGSLVFTLANKTVRVIKGNNVDTIYTSDNYTITIVYKKDKSRSSPADEVFKFDKDILPGVNRCLERF